MSKSKKRLYTFVAVSVLVTLSGECFSAQAELVEVRKIWDEAPHNAFTGLVRFKNRWFCTFREGKDHVSPDGALRVIASTDGKNWESAARLSSDNSDLRDPKLSITPQGQLMLLANETLHKPTDKKYQSLVWFSDDGAEWGERIEIGEPDIWLWRVTWHKEHCYGIGYREPNLVRLYKSADGRKFEPLVKELAVSGSPNEAALVFHDDVCHCLLRRDGDPAAGVYGTSQPPYTDWKWKDLDRQIGGPALIRLPDGRWLAGVRLYDGQTRTSLCWLDLDNDTLTECLKLPSGGDTSYAGLVWHDDLLWVSYYSSHEGRTSIYLATVRFR
jgi:hypothetical protein